MLYSVIVPVYNRPDEIRELLQSLTNQTFKSFEVLIIEDGSDKSCEHVVNEFSHELNVHYYFKENSGQGFSRNFGFQKASGNYFIVFDSDCIVPPHYFQTVHEFIRHKSIDCWGGPDRANDDFSPVQKAINFSMTSFLTTGGIRGNKNRIGDFHPRSFNMGISREVFEKTGGYKITRMGEDIEFSIRIMKSGFKCALIEDAWVYHKRRTNLKQFYKQLHFFGRARINIYRFHPEELKPVHFFPLLFITGLIFSIPAAIIGIHLFQVISALYAIYFTLLFFTALIGEKQLGVALLSLAAACIQLSAYGVGLFKEGIRYLRAG